MTTKNKPSASQKLAYVAAFLVGLSITTLQAGDRDDLSERIAKYAGHQASKSPIVQQGLEAFESFFPREGAALRRYVPAATRWGRFKQKCTEFFGSFAQCFGCTNGANDDE
jgi:hypothetical protein